MGNVSSRAKKRKYTAVSTADLNEDPPENASDMDKLKAQARKDDVVKKSKLLQALEKEKEEKGEK